MAAFFPARSTSGLSSVGGFSRRLHQPSIRLRCTHRSGRTTTKACPPDVLSKRSSHASAKVRTDRAGPIGRRNPLSPVYAGPTRLSRQPAPAVSDRTLFSKKSKPFPLPFRPLLRMSDKDRVPDYMVFRKAHGGAPTSGPARPDARCLEPFHRVAKALLRENCTRLDGTFRPPIGGTSSAKTLSISNV